METTGFFIVHVGDPGQEPKGEAEVVASGYSVLLGWMQGRPYLVDLGGADKILVNAAPIHIQQRQLRV